MAAIPYGRQWVDEDDIRAVCEVLRSDWLTCGPAVRRFEEAVAEYCGARHAVAVCNGTAALHVACAAMGIKRGDIGVTSPLSFLASANCIAYCGGRPDFADIDSRTYCLSPGHVDEFVGMQGVPSVVIPVDFAGVPADLGAFRVLADKHGFGVIEDAAHSLGSSYEVDGRAFRCGCCAHTEMAILSFHPVKTITTGEGGMVLTNDAGLARRARMLANHGLERDAGAFEEWPIDRSSGAVGDGVGGGAGAAWLYQQQILGYNFRITDIQCALGLSQLGRLDQFAARRRAIVSCYDEAFGGDPRLSLQAHPDGSDPVHHLYVLRVRNVRRDVLAGRLRARGVGTQVHYIPIHLQPWYRREFGYQVGKCPAAEALYGECISLPLFPRMTDEEVDRVVAAVGESIESDPGDGVLSR